MNLTAVIIFEFLQTMPIFFLVDEFPVKELVKNTQCADQSYPLFCCRFSQCRIAC